MSTMSSTCGIDWAEDHHDVCLLDETGTVLARERISADAVGFTRLLAIFAEHAENPASIRVAIETEKNLLVTTLARTGYTIYPINPRAVARYRERTGQAGGKSDAGDARVLAEILRTDAHLHRTLPAISESGLAVRALARQHQEAIWAQQQTTCRLRSVLTEFYPQALVAFPKLTHRAALEILAMAPTPATAEQLTRRRITAGLRRCGRRNDPSLVEHILTTLKAPALRQPLAVEAALGTTVTTLLGILTAMVTAVTALEKSLATAFDAHPQAQIYRSVPGVGTVLGARLMAEIGDDPHRFTTAAGLRAFSGTAPITRASGRSHYVMARKVRNKRLADACHWWTFSALTKSPGARAHYDRRRSAGEHHNPALRNLANKMIGKLYWCLQHHRLWDENTAWTSPQTPSLGLAA
jgi:transposase